MSLTYLPHYEWFFALLAGVVILCAWVRPRFGFVTAALIGYLSASSLFSWVFVENHFYPIFFYEQQSLRFFAADSLGRLLLIAVPMMLLSEGEKFWSRGVIAVSFLVALNSVGTVAQALLTDCGRNYGCSLFGNPSIMASLAVCTLPIIAKDWKGALIALPAVILSKSSVAVGLLGIYLLINLVGQRRYVIAFAAAAAPFLVGRVALGAELFNSSDRFKIWDLMMHFWAGAKWPIPLGTGFGTYHVISAPLQQAGGMMQGHHWNTLHNDWLQMLFEGGLVGAALMVLTYLRAFFRSFLDGRSDIALSIFLYGIYMGVNPALHHALPALFGCWLFTLALRQTKNLETI